MMERSRILKRSCNTAFPCRYVCVCPALCGWINAGFMVLEPSIIDLIEGDQTVFEKEPLVEAARMGQLNAYRHKGFWQCMDTLREKNLLEALWQSGQAPWKIWE